MPEGRRYAVIVLGGLDVDAPLLHAPSSRGLPVGIAMGTAMGMQCGG